MHETNQLFSAEEAFVRLGQSRERGCLAVVSAEDTVRIFVEDGFVVHAQGEKAKGEAALQDALQMNNSSYVWIPRAVAKEKPLKVNITAYTIKHSIARDTKVGATGKVGLDDIKAAVDKAPTKTPANVSAGNNTKPNAVTKGKGRYFLIAEGYADHDLPIKKATNIIGRDPACDLVLQNIQVSRRHCLLDIQVRGIYIRDLGSTNGMTINGVPATEGYVTCDDRIQFGTYKVKLHKEEVG